MSLDVQRIKKDFPILETLANGKRLVYLDSAATSQKPRAVIDRMVGFYEEENANVHRGMYELGEKATVAYKGAGDSVARFIGARSPKSIIFTRVQPSRSTWFGSPGDAPTSMRETRSSSPRWSATQPDPVADAGR